MKRRKKSNGYVLLYSVIILGMVVLAMALYLSWLGVFSLQNRKQTFNSKTAQSLADTCAENALMELWNDPDASGTTTRSNLFGGSCSYDISGSGETKTIEATGTINNITRKTKVTTSQITVGVTVDSWQEVADF